MQLTPWIKPFRRDLTRSNREMNPLWNDFLGELRPFEEFGEEWLPSIDVTENDSEILVRAELPGVEAKDIDLNISGDILTVRGEKKEENEKKDKKYFSRESYYGALERSIRLPAEAQTENVEAKFKDGVLNVVFPKSEKSRSKKIEIEA